MTENDAFLRAIIENPEDDAPRLMYADWLEERGDPRAEFIRVQYALEQLPEDDEDRPALHKREQELLAAHGQEWVGRLRELTTGWRFRRGFVEEVRLLPQTFLARGNELFWLAPVRRVKLPYRDENDLVLLPRCPHLERVRALDLRGGHPEIHDIVPLLDSPHLEHLVELSLDLSLRDAAQAQTFCAYPWRRFQVLEIELDIWWPRTVPGLTRFPRLSGLRELSVVGIAIGNEGLHGLAELSLAAQMTSLELRPAQVDPLVDAHALAASRQMTQLASLTLNRNNIGPAGMRALAESPQLASLRELHLDQASVGEEGAAALATSLYLKQLVRLSLGRDLLGTTGVGVLVESPNLNSVQFLNLASNGLDDEAAKSLAQSPQLTRLIELSLDNNRIGPCGARALSSSPLLRRLTRLGLRNNPIGDKGAEALLASPYLTGIQSLGHIVGLSPEVAGRIRARFPNDYLPLHQSRL